MSEPWIVYLLIFALVGGGVYLAQVGLRGQLKRERLTAKRFAALDQSQSELPQVDVLRKKASTNAIGAFLVDVQLLIVQAGSEMTPAALGRRAAMIWAALFLLTPLPLPGLVRFLITGLATGLLVYAYLSFRRGRRIARFAEQLPDVIDVIVRSLRAGHPLPVSLALVAREMPAPTGPEFSAVVDEINYGRSIIDALELFEKRIGYHEVRFFVSSIAIAQQTGGNLAEILSRLAKMLRERFKLKRKIRALSAEGRFSGYALSSLPILLFGLINLVSATYYQEFWQSSARLPVLIVAGGLLLVGNVLIYKMVNFKV
jgi:tight adherence protein B